MYEMMDPQALRQRRREMLREAEQGRLAVLHRQIASDAGWGQRGNRRGLPAGF
jgi:hypothetical protein